MIRIQSLTVISFTGKDAGSFLHNQLTADIKTLAPGDCTFAALCQPKGRVMALLLVHCVEEGFQVVCRQALADRLVTYLLRFRFREKLEISVQDDLAVVALEKQDSTAAALAPIPGVGFAIVGSDAAPAPNPLAEEHIEAMHLALGVVWLDEATTEQFLPQMLGEDIIGALNFRKGCFPGQEVIARTRYLGKLKRHPWTGRVSSADLPAIMDKVVLGNSAESASGVLVARANAADGSQQVFIVARRTDTFEVSEIVADNSTLKASGEWLLAPSEVKN